MYNYGTSAVDLLRPAFEVLEGGAEVAADNVVELIADNGTKIADITTRQVTATNGTAASVAEVVDITAGASTGTATGAGILAMDVGLAGAAIAPCLGVAAGFGLYNLAPEFWTDVSNRLMEAGATVKGKVVALIDADGKTSFPENVIETFKEALLDANIYTNTDPVAPTTTPVVYNIDNVTNAISVFNTSHTVNATYLHNNVSPSISYDTILSCVSMSTDGYGITNAIAACLNKPILLSMPVKHAYGNTYGNYYLLLDVPFEVSSLTIQKINDKIHILCDSIFRYVATAGVNAPGGSGSAHTYPNDEDFKETNDLTLPDFSNYIRFDSFISNFILPPSITPGEIYPDPDIPFPQTYPDWQPSTFPEPLPETMPDVYPVELPDSDTDQESAQEGENTSPSQLDDLVNLIYNTLPAPDPHIVPDVDPSAEVEPSTQPQPDPDPNPSNPNPEPTPSPVAPSLPTLDSTNVNRMYTVYNPTDAQINSLGAFLWTDSIIEQLKKLWQDPMDAIISFHKVYGAPTTGSSSNIILGYIDSGVSSLVVSSQFTEVDCGSVTVPERLHNATDYAPFTALQIYLPFIGIMELDTNELMNATLHVRYRIDVYTGTCVAIIGATRENDMPTEQILYTFSGNCAQALPLTSSNFRGAINSLLSLAGAGVSVATGGALGAVAGAMGVAHSLTSEMVHLQHSGGLSANAGILSYRKPYLILSRQYGYDAAGYSGFYGYPANKSVYIGNCTGYIQCKDVIFNGSCTEAEANEIVSLLKNGVYI